jgi:hypothetical protein
VTSVLGNGTASAGRGWLRRSARSVFLAACLGLAGCQASNLGDGLSASNSGVAALGNSTYGNGPVQVTMLLPTDAPLRRKAADIADGARLALDDLGAGQLRIDFQTSSSTSGQAASKVQAAAAAGAKLIIGPATNGK